MSLMAAAIESEIIEIVGEILDAEPFELTPTAPFAYFDGGAGRADDIRRTLELAFGITIDAADTARLVNLQGALEVVEVALAAKRPLRLVSNSAGSSELSD